MQHKNRFFEQLVSAYANDLYRYAYWLCKQPTLAEDLVQETFARAWKSIESLKDEKAGKAWLITILRRENARLYEKYQPQLLEIEESLVADDYRNEPSNKLEKEQLHHMILKLPDEYKEPLILQVMWGFSGDEIANELDLKLATVNTRLFRARQQLKQLVNDENAVLNLMMEQEGAKK
ncbi:sigma-70 family RNA polymerase sigma factor [Thiomicrorhabdus lithotrophica]|uniref:RNA polymerase sigma factor n=1 Tax=Thiomicrorhabdus lithotrophica TaxID=2949997 RepID=A0ABY8CDR8_9GAMM|nr:sigma-70 family RNA polymerase sigma factor [Thiomicrorhabdus lithotrophica]WEJ62283.1 sigma-70 family RNA polymerase sigma factor [Thiomicrorhabdus lithotrophica]